MTHQGPARHSPRYAEMAIPLPMDHTFTYSVPPALQDRVAVGMRAFVPMASRIETGYIVSLQDHTEVETVRELLDLPDESPVFSEPMLNLCQWLAEYYCCSWGEALQCALPAGLKSGARMRYHLIPGEAASGRFSERQRTIIAALFKRGPLLEHQIASLVGRKSLSSALHALIKRGVVRAEPALDETSVSIRTETWVCLREDNVLPVAELLHLQRRAPKQAAVYLDLLHGQPERTAAELCGKHAVTLSVVQALVDKGLVNRIEREFYRRPDMSTALAASGKHELNPEQQQAHDAITQALDSHRFQTFLLRGITGSGKTEVYLQAIEHALALGKDAIILVPEISLTPQTVGRFYARFQQSIAVLHSGLSLGERYDEWRRAQRGEVKIVVGARSAVFAPLRNVGILIVDEEHDNSYKQGETPRYHARDVAIMRAKRNNAVCVLGSATPSIESFHNSEIGKSIRLELRQRATASPLPEVKLIDMRIETKETSGQIILSRSLEEAVNARIDAREQVILLLNRRGFAPYVLCPSCGWVAPCDNCQVSMTYHSSGGMLHCHYCGAQRIRPEQCCECGFKPLLYLGTGTQKAEDYLLRSFPRARIGRMDADTTSGKGGHAKILGRFANGEIDILIGTQMLAKGHDYPGVTLVGVINADTGLNMPDFRAAEQTFQLLTQVAGRAGRGDRPGEVYIQTFRPRHYAVQAAAHHDYTAFHTEELRHRQAAGYPPFRRMANLSIESEDPALAERHAVLLKRLAREAIETQNLNGVEILGPAPALIRRVNKKYRWNLALLSRSAQRLNTLARALRDAFPAQALANKLQLKIDLDPYGSF